MKIKGIYETRQTFVDGKELTADYSLSLRNHSPDGHSWGYSGSGCAQFALSLLLSCCATPTALKHYQALKNELIAKLPQNDFEVDFNLNEWVFTKEQIGDIEKEKNRTSFYKTFSDAPITDSMGHKLDI